MRNEETLGITRTVNYCGGMDYELTIFAGPNGCGKSTLAEFLLEAGSIKSFVNADIIAKGLSPQDGLAGEITAGRILLERLHSALENRENIAFETTMSGRTWIKLIKSAQALGYNVALFYVLVRSVDIAIARVEERVRRGGHHIPSEVIKRRFIRSKQLFLETYSNVCNRWYLIDNSADDAIIVAKKEAENVSILDETLYEDLWR